jgi:nucleotide-binding universal stress UspA family protein
VSGVTPEAVSGGTRRPIIVVGVSGSRASAAALRWAADEALRRHGQLRVVLVWSPQHRAAYAPPLQVPDEQQQMLHARGLLAATMQAVLGVAPRDEVMIEIAEGTPERVLADRSAGADLLVLGSASAHAMAGHALGPVIRTCLSHARCPVVIVGPEERAADYRQTATGLTAGPVAAAAPR